jgi:hypothetical protein
MSMSRLSPNAAQGADGMEARWRRDGDGASSIFMDVICLAAETGRCYRFATSGTSASCAKPKPLLFVQAGEQQHDVVAAEGAQHPEQYSCPG